MDELTRKIKHLNEIYKVMQKEYTNLKKMFTKQSTIKQKICLSEQILNQAYMSIMDGLESEEINKEFVKIIKTIKNDK